MLVHASVDRISFCTLPFRFYDAHESLRASRSRDSKIIRNPPYRATYSWLFGALPHAFSCKHETHELWTLVFQVYVF